MGVQMYATVVVGGWAFLMTLVWAFLLNVTIGFSATDYTPAKQDEVAHEEAPAPASDVEKQ